jgi:hypothetical protein
MVAAAPIANEVLVANLRKIADKRRAAPVVVAPPVSSSGEGRDGGVFVFVIVNSSSYYNQPWRFWG